MKNEQNLKLNLKYTEDISFVDYLFFFILFFLMK